MNRSLILLVLAVASVSGAQAQQNKDTNRTPVQVLSSSWRKILELLDRPEDAPPKTFYVTLEVRKAEGLPKGFADLSAKIALQPPNRAWISTDSGEKSYSLGRDGQRLWIHSAAKHFAVVGEPGRSRWSSEPDPNDTSALAPLKLPVEREKLLLLPFMMDVVDKNWVDYEDMRLRVLEMTLKKEAVEALKIPQMKVKLWLDTNDIPIRVGYSRENPKMDVQVLVNNLRLDDPWPDERWQMPAGENEKVEKTGLSTLRTFMQVWLESMGQRVPSLGKAGERKRVATAGEGRLEIIEGMRVLFLKGTPREMGRQQGLLLAKQIRDVVDRSLYGIGVGSSLDTGKWFPAEVQSAQKQLSPFMHPDYLAEMDAMAAAANIDKQEVQLANFYPEMFHCSVFSVYGKSTATGKMYHGRVLDYLKGVGLEQDAVITVIEPEGRNAWVNIGFAGFVGSVTAMNDKQLAIGEMGGHHAEEWEGKPMAQLVRDIMERADTLEDAVQIIRQSPRTCDYSYLISDGKTRRALGIRATSTKVEIIEPDKKHDKAPDPIKDAVVISADKRYEELTKRIKEKHGKIDGGGAWEFMKKPVAMDSNIQTVMFMPETLEFWVAYANGDKIASECEARKFNLAKLLDRSIGDQSQPPTAKK